jgi:hypothetical protein
MVVVRNGILRHERRLRALDLEQGLAIEGAGVRLSNPLP